MDEGYDLYLPLSALNAYLYCPYRAYVEYVLGEWEDNVFTIEGEIEHETVHSEKERVVDDSFQTTRVFVKSEALGLVGQIDVVEERAAEIYPVEYKKGRQGRRLNDQVQVCAQGLCLAEQLGREISRGYVWYMGSRRRREVKFTPELVAATEKTCQDLRALYEGAPVPIPAYRKSRCDPCSVLSFCLPRETAILRAGP